MANGITPVIFPDQNEELLLDFTTEEVKAAPFNIYPWKTPGPNGFSGIFYHKFWGVIGEDVT